MIKIYQGDSIDLIFPVKDTDGALLSDLGTAIAIKFMVKTLKTDSDGSALISKSLGSGVTADSPTLGYITVNLDRADTLSIVGIKYFGVQIEYSASSVKELFINYDNEYTDQIEFLKGVID